MFRASAIAAALILSSDVRAASLLENWRNGPVATLLTAEDYRAFGRLGSDDERRTFIEDFWRSVDADSGSAPGTYREMFHERCVAIDDRYQSRGPAGWRTDRGRVYLALGEPASIRREAGSVNSLEREIWSYGDATGGTGSVQAQVSFVFYRCPDGSYRLDGSCAVEGNSSSVAYDAERAAYIRKVREENPTLGIGSATVNGFLQPVPGGIAVPQHVVVPSSARRDVSAPVTAESGDSGVHALENAAYFFRAQDGTVLTLLTVELLSGADVAPESGGERASLVAAASVEETGRRGEDLPESFAREVALEAVPADGDDRPGAAFFGRVYLQPGRTYAVRYAVKDSAHDQVFMRNDLLGVPVLSRGFSVSSVVPAAEFGPAGAGNNRFQIGSEEVVPKAGGQFRRSELLQLYLQVYEAAIHPETSMPRVDVVFRFFRLIKGAGKRLGKPYSVRGATGASMGLALPIGDWPTGPYRVVVQLHDRVSDSRATAEGFFTIADE